MKKKILAAAALASAVVFGVFTGCGNSGDIGRDAALEVALNDAGVSESDTTRLRVSEDRDDGRKVYEIRFDAAEQDSDYEIQASDGAIISSDIETIENNAGIQKDDTQNSASSQKGAGKTDTSGSGDAQGQTVTENQAGQNQSSANSGSAADVAISRDEAIQIALDRVPGANAQNVKIELDRDDGRYKYEGEIFYNYIEYDFEIDANTGTILEWSEERD